LEYKNLATAALEARENSYSPYSGFSVGAALLTKSGKIYTGCNIENAAYSPTLCAERVAMAKAVSAGEREFAAIAIAGGQTGGEPQFCYPCGVCRQVLNEFGDIAVIIAKTPTDYRVHTLAELLPHGFGACNLL
jgi:homotetrameric cytidine deaminase